MDYPFGGHPTLREYIGWCNQQGCTTHSELRSSGGQMCAMQILVAKKKRHLIISGMLMSERLTPTMVAHFDRRLGLNSPFPKVGDGSYRPEGV